MAADFPRFGAPSGRDCARVLNFGAFPEDTESTSTASQQIAVGQAMLDNALSIAQDSLISQVFKKQTNNLVNYIEKWGEQINPPLVRTYGDVVKDAFEQHSYDSGFSSWVTRMYSHESGEQSVFTAARYYSIDKAIKAGAASACSFFFFADPINILDAKFSLLNAARFIEEYYPEDLEKPWEVFLHEVMESYNKEGGLLPGFEEVIEAEAHEEFFDCLLAMKEPTEDEKRALVRYALYPDVSDLYFTLLNHGISLEIPDNSVEPVLVQEPSFASIQSSGSNRMVGLQYALVQYQEPSLGQNQLL